MRHTNYSKAETLEEVHEINKSTWGYNLTERYNDLMDCAKECETIKELGINQGSSLDALLMCKPKHITGIDITLSAWKNGSNDGGPGLEERAIKYCEKNNIKLETMECSSIDPKCASEVDMLHIDSLHNAGHLAQELQLHGPLVKKYIVFHDTAVNNYELYNEVKRWISNNPGWAEKKHYHISPDGRCVGHLVIEKIL